MKQFSSNVYKAALECILDWPADYEECTWPQIMVFIKAVFANDLDAFVYPEKLKETQNIWKGPSREWVEAFEKKYDE